MIKPETVARVDEIIAKLDESDGMFVLQMMHKIIELQNKIKRQDERLTEYSWTVNPDRMGGQFSQDEIDRSHNGGW